MVVVKEALRRLNEITSLRKDQELKIAAFEDGVLRLNRVLREMEVAIGKLGKVIMVLHSESAS